eukprot:749076-Hanusia_phi.AAC.2
MLSGEPMYNSARYGFKNQNALMPQGNTDIPEEINMDAMQEQAAPNPEQPQEQPQEEDLNLSEIQQNTTPLKAFDSNIDDNSKTMALPMLGDDQEITLADVTMKELFESDKRREAYQKLISKALQANYKTRYVGYLNRLVKSFTKNETPLTRNIINDYDLWDDLRALLRGAPDEGMNKENMKYYEKELQRHERKTDKQRRKTMFEDTKAGMDYP